MFSLTKEQNDKIERLQKMAFYKILGKDANKHYIVNRDKLGCDTLEDRRDKFAENLAKKVLKHPEHRKMFKLDTNNKTRKGKKMIVPQSSTARYSNSTIPSLGNLINEKLRHKI